MNPFQKLSVYLWMVLTAVVTAGTAQGAGVPVRISIKFILDVNGKWPASGNINTVEEVNAEVTAAINILASQYSELTIDQVELIDLAGVSQWYSVPAKVSDPDPVKQGANRDALRNAAIADPATYHWRNDAINIYINGAASAAISDFPPNNNIIFVSQGCGNTPSCMLHELGHTLKLAHTHETNTADGDYCSDTISDNQSWTKDQVAQNNFGCNYADCTIDQQAAVAMTYNNVMSYHVDEPQTRLSPCQLDRISAQSDTDRDWLLTTKAVYVSHFSNFPTVETGRFSLPFISLQKAILYRAFSNRVLVLQQGTYTMSQEMINDATEIVTRSGPSEFSRGFQSYTLPVDIENSKHPKVRRGALAVQDEDLAGRKVVRDAEEAEKKATRREDKSAIRAEAKARRKVHQDNALKGLLEAEGYAEKDEKLAIQMELAQRYRDAGECEKAIRFFTKVAETTDQSGLKQAANLQINLCRKKIQK